MPQANGASWITEISSLISIVWYYFTGLVWKIVSLFKATADVLFRPALQALLRVIRLFFWSPAEILLRNFLHVLLIPTNIPLLFFYDITVDDIGKVNLYMAIVTVTTCIQYFITLLIIGVFFGVYCGISLGLVHRFIRIPDKYIDFPQGIFKKLLSYFRNKEVTSPSMKFSYESEIPMPSNISLGTRSTNTQRRLSRSSRGSVSNVATNLPHDFFQPKTPSRFSEKRRFDPVKMSPLSMDNDDISETTSMSSNIWDHTDNIPETLRTDITAGTHKSFTSGRESTSLLGSRAFKRGL